MCLGSVFDIFLYNISQDQRILATDPLEIGSSAPRPDVARVGTHSDFELTFAIKPLSHIAHYPANSTCREHYTCGTSVLHVTDGTGDGDCCRVGNRMPLILLDNSSTRMHLAMDSTDQNESMDVRDYDRLQKCSMTGELPVGVWSNIKVKASSAKMSKGQFMRNTTEHHGGIALFVNGVKMCEVLGTQYHTLPVRSQAYVFFGSIQTPLQQDVHIPANAYIRDVKYGIPASNLFVGIMNSVQGIAAVLLMYPIGWMGDRLNRYTLLRANMGVGLLAASVMVGAVLMRNIVSVYTGVILFTVYQQCISSIIYAILADNVSHARRTQAGVNYKTASTLAQALGVLVQLFTVLAFPSEDEWTNSTFIAMLIPGWLLLPVVTLAVYRIKPVGQKFSAIPNVDEVREAEEAQEGHTRSNRLNPAWLDERVFLSQKRRFVVAATTNAFFILTLLANGMTSRYFSLYYTQIMKFSPAGLCLLNGACRLWIALFAQLGKPLALRVGRSNLTVLLHTASALFTLGIYGGGFFEPSLWVSCACYLMRFACLQTRDPLLYSITMDCVPPSQRSRWAALNSLRTLSFAASAVLGGYLADLYGYSFSFNITVVSLLAGLVVFVPTWLWFPRREGASRTEADGGLVNAAPSSPSFVRPPGAARSP